MPIDLCPGHVRRKALRYGSPPHSADLVVGATPVAAATVFVEELTLTELQRGSGREDDDHRADRGT
jgi:hypothetical protein